MSKGKRRIVKYGIPESEAYEKFARQHPKMMTWLSKLQKKSENAHRLYIFCEWAHKTPEQLLELKANPASKDAEYLLDRFVADESNMIPNSLRFNIAIAVKSFFKHNYAELAKASGQITRIPVRAQKRHSKDELLRIYRACQNPRDRALIPFVWSSAIARESLSLVQWCDFEDDWQKAELPHISLAPEKVKGHGKGKYAGVRQETFLTPEAKRDVIEYKEWMERNYEHTFKRDDHVFVELRAPYEPVSDVRLSQLAVELSKASGVRFGWHDGRRYVETALEEIRIHPNWARKIRGRKVKGEESPYSKPAIEQLRKVYAEAVPLLQFTTQSDTDYIKRRQEVSERLMNKIIAGEPLNDEDRDNVKKFNIQLRERTRCARDGCGEFDKIDETRLLEYLRDGWRIVHKLGDGNVIVER